MQIGLHIFKDKQIKTMINSYGRVGNCSVTKIKNCVVYDTEEDSYLINYFEDILDVFTPIKYVTDVKVSDMGKYLREFLFEWQIFMIDLDCIDNIMKSICKEKFLLETEIFTELVTVTEFFDIHKMNELCLLRTYSWEEFCNHIKHINRFHTSHFNMEQLRTLLSNMMIEVPNGTLKLFRSRVCDEQHYVCGYEIKEMGAPNVNLASSGRTNSEGVSCLYMANNEITTFHEIRARHKDHITVGTFVQQKDLKLIDLSLFDEIGPFSIPDFDLTWFAINIEIIRKIGNEVAKPMRRFDRSIDYVPTQYICAFIKHLGYDGIIFKSTLINEGINYAIFDENKFKCQEVCVRYINELHYEWN